MSYTPFGLTGPFKTQTTLALQSALLEMREEVAVCDTIPDSATRAYVRDLEKKIAQIKVILAERDKTTVVL